MNNRIDDKIVRRRQQESASKSKPEPKAQTERQQPPPPPIPPPKANPSRPETNPPLRNEEYSIFRDPPAATASLPPKTRVKLFLK